MLAEQPGEMLGKKREADSKKPFEGVNERKPQRECKSCRPGGSIGHQAIPNFLQKIYLGYCENLSEEKTPAIK